MALSREDCLDLLRYLQERLAETDRRSFELLADHVQFSDSPRRTVIHYLDTLIKIESERSVGSYGWVLDRLNESIRTDSGGPIRAIEVALSPEEAELYGVKTVELARLPDRSDFISHLRRLRSSVIRDGEAERDR